MKFKFKYYDYIIFWCIFHLWINGICGMEQHKGHAITPFATAAVVKAINSNIPTRIERPVSSGKNTFRGYSEVVST